MTATQITGDGVCEARTLAPFGRRLSRVDANDQIGAYRMIHVADPSGPRDPRPGQFYMLASAAGWGGGEGERPYLPRAFSFARISATGVLGFLLEPIGPGTERLAALSKGDDVWLCGPLGIGFSPAAGRRPLLVGGGIGAAPLLALQDELGPNVRALLGFRSATHAAAAELFARPVIVTDDGSAGRAALVTQLLREELDRDAGVAVYACGPPAMLEAVRALCAERQIPAQLAFEAGMACGFGACFGCVIATKEGYLRLCVDGPVLDASVVETALATGAGH